MRRLLLILAIVVPLVCYSKDNFTSIQFSQDTLLWNKIAKDEPLSTWERATVASKDFRTDEHGGITCNYVITSGSKVGVNKIREITDKWFRTKLARNSLVFYDNKKDVFSAFIDFWSMGAAVLIGSKSFINIPADLYVGVKEDSLTFTMSIPHYSIEIYSTLESPEFENVKISECYPFARKSGRKESYSRAYINTISACFYELKSLLNYLNTESNKL